MTPGTGKSRLDNRCNSGFTLIELLVVVAVISLIIAILLPVVRRARQISKRAVCGSNLKQIAIAWHMYLNDNDGRFFQGWNADWTYGGWNGPYTPSPSSNFDPNRPLNGYLGLDSMPQSKDEARVFYCPDDDMGTGEPFYDYVGTSYKTNTLLIGNVAIGTLPSSTLRNAINAKLKNISINQVSNPSSLLLVGDYNWQTQWDSMPPNLYLFLSCHGRCCHFNMAFLDGHVDYIKVHKGLHITEEYRIIPFKDLYGLALQEQVKLPCPRCD